MLFLSIFFGPASLSSFQAGPERRLLPCPPTEYGEAKGFFFGLFKERNYCSICAN